MSRLFRKVLAGQVVLFGVIAWAVSLASAWHLRTHLTSEFRSKGAAIAQSISYSAIDTIVSGDLAAIQAVIDQFENVSGVSYVLVADPAGEVLAHTFIPAIPQRVLQQCREDRAERRRGSDQARTIVREMGETIDVSTPILAGLAGTVHVGMDRGIITDAIRSAILKEQLIVFGLFLGSLLLAFVFVRRISRPLTALAGHAQDLARASFAPEVLGRGSPEPLTSAQDELGELARSFAYMERTLKDHIDRLRNTTTKLEQYSQTLELRVAERTRELSEKNEALQDTVAQLKAAQTQMVMQEKLASLGALTAGIAHEIKNPLNFVNNFSQLSVRLIGDVLDEIETHKERIPPDGVQVIEESLQDLKLNLDKIREHGQRADSIVQNMLLHSRGHSHYRVRTDVNGLLDEYVALAYHGFRARHPDFNVTIETDYDASVPPLELAPQDIGRAIVNLIENALYAGRKKRESAVDHSPVVSVRTVRAGNRVEIRVRDNGTGVTDDIRQKIFNPFFTTKPPGEGTGLGLSITFDIVMAHQGELRLESEPGRFSEFIISLPGSSAPDGRPAAPGKESLLIETDDTQNTGRR